jgi:ABC-type arginine transport system permease subunit
MSETIWLDIAIPVISIIIGVVLGLMIAAIMRANDK